MFLSFKEDVLKGIVTFLPLFIFLFSSLFANEKKECIAALAIGELSLSFKVLSITASLSISNATDKNSIEKIISNTVQTIKDCQIVILPMSKESTLFSNILKATDKTIECSSVISNYSKKGNKKKLSLVKKCMNDLASQIDSVSNIFNKKTVYKKGDQ